MANQAIVAPATVVANANLVDPGFKEVLADNYKMLESKFSKILKSVELRTTAETFSGYTGLGEIPMVNEAGEFGEDAIIPTYNTTLTAYKYGNNLPVSWELLEDDLYGVIGKAKDATDSLTRKAEGLGSDLFNNAHSTSYTSYGDGKPLCSTVHTRADGGTAQSNASSTGITLTEANLETGILAMRGQLDDRGNLISMVPNTLIVPPALEKEAIIITKSTNRSGTADNDANVNGMSVYTGGQLNVIVWDYLGAAAGGSDTAWFLLASGSHKLSYGWRHKPSVKRLAEAVGAKNQITYWQYFFRLALGWRDWRGVWGSKGDGASYTD